MVQRGTVSLIIVTELGQSSERWEASYEGWEEVESLYLTAHVQ